MTSRDQANSAAKQARRKAHPGLALLIIAGTQLMIVLDATIVNIALPSMGHYFHKSQTDMTWAINAYTLAFGGLLLLGGKAARKGKPKAHCVKPKSCCCGWVVASLLHPNRPPRRLSRRSATSSGSNG